MKVQASRLTPVRIVLAIAAITTLSAASTAAAKVPHGAIYEACGESGCAVASHGGAPDALSTAAANALIAPAFRSGRTVAPEGAHPWVRIDLNLDAVRVEPQDRQHLSRQLGRPFPAVLVPDEGVFGALGWAGEYRWVVLRRREARAYSELVRGVQPFRAQPLVDLDAVAVAGAKPGERSPAAARQPDAGSALPLPLLVLVLISIGSLAILGLRRWLLSPGTGTSKPA